MTMRNELEHTEQVMLMQWWSLAHHQFGLISESGLYRILAKCNLPKCEPFESMEVCNERYADFCE